MMHHGKDYTKNEMQGLAALGSPDNSNIIGCR